MNKSSIHNEVKKYLAHLQFERNLSSNTLDSYWLDLKSYIEYMIDVYKIKKLNDIKKDYINKYISYLQTYSDYNNDIKKKQTSSALINVTFFFFGFKRCRLPRQLHFYMRSAKS